MNKAALEGIPNQDNMVIIIGAGLSGLLTGYRLYQAGIAFKILEARDRVGGRIQTLQGTGGTPVEMGATWLGEQHQHLLKLLEELDLVYFPQYMQGTSFFQPFSTSPANSIVLPEQAPSYRIGGGTSALIDRLVSLLPPESISLGEVVDRVEFRENEVLVRGSEDHLASQVILATPPKTWAYSIDFSPSLPKDLEAIAKETHTWMEHSIKVALSYPAPFWRQRQLSGTLFSNTGPLTEFYDHCNQEVDRFALCGFVHPSFVKLSAEQRKEKVMAQLVQVFGEEVAGYTDYQEVVWPLEEHTFRSDPSPLYPHQNNGHPVFRKTYGQGRLLISSTEAAASFPGYMEGAVVAAEAAAAKILAFQQ